MLVSENAQCRNCEGHPRSGIGKSSCHMEKAKQVNNQVAEDEPVVEMVVLQDKSHGMMRGTLMGSWFGWFANLCVILSLGMQGIHAIH